MRDVVQFATLTIRKSRELVRALNAERQATRRNLQTSRALADSCRRLLRKLRRADRVDDPPR
jgi:hypothetical protein